MAIRMTLSAFIRRFPYYSSIQLISKELVPAKDLKPLSPVNVILKYADDTTLPVPQNSPTTLEVEFSHILQYVVLQYADDTQLYIA